MFETTKEHIKALDDVQARELVARLARAEVIKNGGAGSGVHWGGNHRAADEGVDVEVCKTGKRLRYDYLPTDDVIFQVKAETFGPAKVENELRPKGKLRPCISDLGKSGGTYIIASTRDDCARPALSKRHEAMQSCVKDADTKQRPQLLFYDSRKLADWVEQHPSVALWVKVQLGISTSGWQPYGPWAHMETDANSDFILDDKAKIYAPGADDALASLEAIDRLRADLATSCSVRLIGLSGVGKTRLAQALFDERLETSSAPLPKDNVIYCDLSDKLDPTPEQLIDILNAQKSDAVMIVDNCGPAPHASLTKKISSKDCALKLLTIEYDIRDDVPERTRCYRMEGASLEMLRNLLHREFRHHSHENISKIAEFSDGNARIAFALADAVDSGEELQRLRNSELFDRLFRQSHEPNDKLLEAAKALSLLYSFNGEDLGDESELGILAQEAGQTTRDMARAVSKLQKRGLVQARGKWRAVLPHAISNELASRMLGDFNADYWMQQFLPKCSDRMRTSFIRRIGYLHDLPLAKEIAGDLFHQERYSRPQNHDHESRWEFMSLAAVSPSEALDVLERAAETNDFLSSDLYARTDYIRLIGHIAYWPDYFGRCINLLIRCAATETENHGQKPATQLLKDLFTIVLSGTLAEVHQRAPVVQALLDSSDFRALGYELLGSGLKSQHFTGVSTSDFGAHKRTTGWRPTSAENLTDWYKKWFEVVSEYGQPSKEGFEGVRKQFGSRIRSLWQVSELRSDVADLCRELHADKPFPEAWLGVKQALYFDKKKDDHAGRAALKKLEEDLRPQNLREQIIARVGSGPNIGLHELEEDATFADNDEGMRREQRQSVLDRTKELGKAAGEDIELLRSLLPIISGQKTGSGSFELGLGIGEAEENTELIIEEVRTYLAYKGDEWASLIWFRGFLKSLARRDREAFERFMDRAKDDEIWLRYFVELQQMIDLDQRAYERLMAVMKRPECSSRQFGYLAIGSNTKALNPTQIKNLLYALKDRDAQGAIEAFDILYMVKHGAKDRDGNEVAELRAVAFQYLSDLDWSQVESWPSQTEHQIQETISNALDGDIDRNEVARLLRQIIPTDGKKYGNYNETRKVAMRPFFEKQPVVALEEVCQPDEEGSYDYLYFLLGNRFQDDGASMLGLVPDEALLDWCKIDLKKRVPVALEHLPIFEANENESGLLNPRKSIKLLWKEAEDKREALAHLVNRIQPRSWSGSRADIIEKRANILAALEDDATPDMLEAIAEKRGELKHLIEQERAHELKEQKRELESFE